MLASGDQITDTQVFVTSVNIRKLSYMNKVFRSITLYRKLRNKVDWILSMMIQDEDVLLMWPEGNKQVLFPELTLTIKATCLYSMVYILSSQRIS